MSDLTKEIEMAYSGQMLPIENETELLDVIPCAQTIEPMAKPIVPPIYTTSIYKISSFEHYEDIKKKNGYTYSRHGNPTVIAAENAVNASEGGAGAVAFASGTAAISTALFAFLKPGDHVVACNPVYGGTYGLFNNFLSRFNIEVSWVYSTSAQAYEDAIKPNTKVLYGETPCNPLLSILDLEAFGKLGQSLDGVVTMVDSTFGSPYLQQPLKYGVDLSLHSCTKYIGGHSDLTAGMACCRKEQHVTTLRSWRSNLGPILSAYDAAGVYRGMQTLGLRMERHSATARRVADFLVTRPEVTRVYYPGLPSHSGHQQAKIQMKNPGGVVSFEMKDGFDAVKRCMESTRHIAIAASVGGPESTMNHIASMAHNPSLVPVEERRKANITDELIRLSVGLEDADILLKDLAQALDKV